MELLLAIAQPHIGIYTRSDAVHSEQFGNPQAIAVDDMKMIRASKHSVFLNADDVYARQIADQLSGRDSFLYMTTGDDKTVYDEPPLFYTNDTIIYDDQDIVHSAATVSVS